jgi:hypothetical protein
LYYNIHRWYQPGVGRYSRPDPLLGDSDFRGVLGRNTVFETLSILGGQPYLYARAQQLSS